MAPQGILALRETDIFSASARLSVLTLFQTLFTPNLSNYEWCLNFTWLCHLYLSAWNVRGLSICSSCYNDLQNVIKIVMSDEYLSWKRMFCFCCRSEWICPRVQRLLQSVNRSVVRLQSSWLVAEGFGNTQICNYDTSNIVFCLYVWYVADCLPWCLCEGLSLRL